MLHCFVTIPYTSWKRQRLKVNYVYTCLFVLLFLYIYVCPLQNIQVYAPAVFPLFPPNTQWVRTGVNLMDLPVYRSVASHLTKPTPVSYSTLSASGLTTSGSTAGSPQNISGAREVMATKNTLKMVTATLPKCYNCGSQHLSNHRRCSCTNWEHSKHPLVATSLPELFLQGNTTQRLQQTACWKLLQLIPVVRTLQRK